MKQRTLYIFTGFLIAILIAFGQVSSAQNLILQTNKKVYVSGEEVGFKCTLLQQNGHQNNILFVDICGEGYIVSSQFLKRENSHWSGRISLPDTMQTGVYLLRTYIGNSNGQPTIASEPLTVFNRFGNHDVNESRKLQPGYSALIQENQVQQATDGELVLKANKQTYSPKEEIELTIENNLENSVGGVSVSVFKTTGKAPAVKATSNEYPVYSPSDEVRIYSSLILSGRLSNQATNEPVTNETVILSIPDSIPNINYAYTNENGEFRFVLNNLYGQQDIIVQTINKQQDYNIKLFPVLLLPPNKIPFFIPAETEEDEFTRLAIQRATLHKAYGKTAITKQKATQQKIPFYGISTNRVYPSLYVPLDDFKEIAWEILPTVKYRADKDSTYLRIWNPQSKGFYFNPWTLVDGVPVYNNTSLNLLNSEKISWIEMQPQVRCYGDLFIEGLINIETRNGDFSDIPLPKNAVRKKIETFFDYSAQPETDQPLFRDVLYWNPKLSSEKKVQQIKVESSYEQGNYAAIVQTVDALGKIHQSVFNFTVE